MNISAAIERNQFWILLLATSFAFVHVKLVWEIDDANLLFSSLIFWPAAFVLAKEVPWIPANFNAGTVLAGLSLLSIALFQAFNGPDDFLYLYPFLVGVGGVVALFGVRGLRQYWQSLLALFSLGTLEIILFSLVNPAPLTARFADALLWYAGYDVLREGIWLHLPAGSVEVVQSCSGLRAMTRLVSMSLLAMLCLPQRWSKPRISLLLLTGIALGFLSNVLRVALLAILNASDHAAAFESLHTGSTSQLFSIVNILLLMMAVWRLAQQTPDRNIKQLDHS